MARIAIMHTEADASLAQALAIKLRAAGHEVQPETPGAALVLVLATQAFEDDAQEQARAMQVAQAQVCLAKLDLGAHPHLLAPAPRIGWDLEELEGLLVQVQQSAKPGPEVGDAAPAAPPARETLLLRVRYLADTLRRASGEEHTPHQDASLQRLLFLERYLSTRLTVIDGELSQPLAPKPVSPAGQTKTAASPMVQVLAPLQVRPGRTFQAEIAVALPASPEPAKARRKVRVLLETARSGPSGSMQQRASGRDGETLRFTFRLRAGRGQPGRSLLRASLECDGRRLGEVSWPLEITPEAPVKPQSEAQGSFKAYLPT